MLVTWEDIGNAASTSTLLAGSASTPSSARSSVRWLVVAALSVGLGGFVERVVNYLVDKNGAIHGVHGVICSLVQTPPSPLVCGHRKSCIYKPFNYKFTII